MLEAPATKSDSELLEESWGRAFVHEGGHALVALLQDIPCYGIYWKKDGNKFCALSPLNPEYTHAYYVFLAGGSAAEVVTFGSFDEEGANADKVSFGNSDAPAFEKCVEEAQALLTKKKRILKRLVSLMKSKCLRANLNIANLAERIMDGTGEKFAELLSEVELRDAYQRK